MNEYCENPLCENEGSKEVPVSVNRPGDQRRTFCAVCEEAYATGVQHGRFETAVVTDRGLVEYARAFPSQTAAEAGFLKYLREHHGYRGPKCVESLYEWVGEQAYLTAEIVEQDSLA